jgi:photosystem II stability/assembly factor-like uncharacterized protein
MLAATLRGSGLLVLVVLPCVAQTPEFVYRQGGHSHGIQFWNENDGVVVEDGGRIRYTVDGGTTWTDSNFDDEYREDLRGVFVRVGSQDAWAVGKGGAVLRTTNRGQDWERLNEDSGGDLVPILDENDVPAELYDIWMFDEEEGWVVGLDGVLKYTADGGVTWSDNPPGGTPADIQTQGMDVDDLYDIFWVDASIAIAPSDYTRYYRTTDGGLTWSVESTEGYCAKGTASGTSPLPNVELWMVDFLPGSSGSSAEGWMVGGASTNGGSLFHTTDAGATFELVTDFRFENWSPTTCGLPTMYTVASFGPIVAGSPPYGGTVALSYGQRHYRFENASPSDVYDVCGGCTSVSPVVDPYWSDEAPAPPATGMGVLDPGVPHTGAFALDAYTGWAVGRSGLVRRTDDSGATWQEQGSVQPLRLDGGGDFVSPTTGCIFGQNNVIQRTTDGGLTFDVVWPSGSGSDDGGGAGIDLDFSDVTGVGIAIGSGDKVRVTDDSGATWTLVAGLEFGSSPTSASFVPGSDTLFVVGLDGLAYRVENGGVDESDWTELTLPTEFNGLDFYGVSFVATYVSGGVTYHSGYIVGEDETVRFSANSGATWSAVDVRSASVNHNLLSVQAFGTLGADAVAVGTGGRVFLRENGGDFARLTLPSEVATANDLNDVRVFNGGDDWVIAGNRGTVLFYDGTDWSAPKTKTSEDLYDAPFVDPDEGFVIGKQFLVCKYE